MKSVLLLTLATLAQSTSSCIHFDACSQPMSQQARALLQARTSPSGSALEISANTTLSGKVNPSGAAAPLDESGYQAVADRCCQAEMQEFIHRQAKNLGLEVCDAAGLRGIVQYHSCEKGRQSFTALTANLLLDSGKRCTWLGTTGPGGAPQCPSRPLDCPNFSGAPLPDCGCSQSKAATIDNFKGSSVTHSNLGGVGPDAGAQELRYSNIGISESGQRFDLVVTTLTPYDCPGPQGNGVKDKFGRINMKTGTSTDFLFSFMMPGTSTPLKLSEVHMGIFDVDGNLANDLESFASKGYAGYVTDPSPSMVAAQLLDGRTQFSSDGANPNVPNPSDPGALTLEQRKSCVMFFYKNVDSFQLTFTIGGSGNWGRALSFLFDSPLKDRCGP